MKDQIWMLFLALAIALPVSFNAHAIDVVCEGSTIHQPGGLNPAGEAPVPYQLTLAITDVGTVQPDMMVLLKKAGDSGFHKIIAHYVAGQGDVRVNRPAHSQRYLLEDAQGRWLFSIGENLIDRIENHPQGMSFNGFLSPFISAELSSFGSSLLCYGHT